MRLNILSLAIAAALTTGNLSYAYAESKCEALRGSDDVDISNSSPDRCLPGSNKFQDEQWNLLNSGQSAFSLRGGTPGADLNLWWAHRLGVLGQGINVSVVDDGLDIAHPDLAANVRPGSKNFLNNSSDPTPVDEEDAHGTSVTGIIAAVDNAIGVKGVAPKVKVQGFNLLATGSNQAPEDFIYALGGSPATEDNRLFNQSYGVSPMETEDSELLKFKELDALYERKTLQTNNGASYIKAAGNGFELLGLGRYSIRPKVSQPQIPFQNSNIEVNSTNFWNLVVSATNADGVRASYSSVGSNIFVAAPGGERGTVSPAHVTTDPTGCDKGYNRRNSPEDNLLHNNPGLDPNCDYNGIMNGTSSATPNTTGSLALLLSAFPELSARDLRDILAHTSRRLDPDHSPAVLSYSSTAGRKQVTVLEGWEKNAAGFWFSPTYGFGLIDVNKALKQAATHKPLPALIQLPWQTVKPKDAAQAAIPDVGSQATTSSATINDSITVEAVQVRLNLDHQRLSDLLIELVSPSGTRSVLLNPKNSLVAQSPAISLFPETGFKNFRLLSNKFYGEKSSGEWKLLITDVNNGAQQMLLSDRLTGQVQEFSVPNNTRSGRLIDWSIRVFGH